MKIKRIVLDNIGSYEGKNEFDFTSSSDKNIVLIGGKNGAGKTTLFTAMRLCLYGYLCMGYKNKNSYYTRTVTKLINNNVKLVRPANACVSMEIEINNGRELDVYELSRFWRLDETFSEFFYVKRNGITLAENEVADFEKYLFNIIPPELFNFYFFDGEKIADFFLEDGGDTRLKNAFLTLCGYDTFDIMRKHFKRVGTGKKNSSETLEEYLTAMDLLKLEQQEYDRLQNELDTCVDEITMCDAELVQIEIDYTQGGGITQDEWNQKLIFLKEEEQKRENWNALLKKWANDLIPFLMVTEELELVKNQIESENNFMKYKNFCEIIDMPQIKVLLQDKKDQIKEIAHEVYADNETVVLDLSIDQTAVLLNQINAVLSFEKSKVKKCKQLIRRSLNNSAKIRSELECSNIASVQKYMESKNVLLERKTELLDKRILLEQKIMQQENKLQYTISLTNKAKAKLEEELKKESIVDISSKAIMMLDKLQDTLYRQQIDKVESFFKEHINIMMRKQNFIDDIKIDDNFGIHIYRTEQIEVEKILDIVSMKDTKFLTELYGIAAVQKLNELASVSWLGNVERYLECSKEKYVELPFEIDKNSLSNGEKQIFIMTLYYSLVQLGKHEIPFVIDTPFARIDKEHRKNISQHFFSKLRGQIFILSTNEEIDSEHVLIMKNQIAKTYMLENADNKRTTIVQNSYFEV